MTVLDRHPDTRHPDPRHPDIRHPDGLSTGPVPLPPAGRWGSRVALYSLVRTALAALATALAATALMPLFAGFLWWYLPALASIATAAAAGTVSRVGAARRAAGDSTRTLLVPGVVVLFVFGCVLTAFCAPSTGLGGVVPTWSTPGALVTLLHDSRADIANKAAPIPHTRGLVLLIILSVYAVARMVDRLTASRWRPAHAGLPLLALFALPAAVVPSKIGVLPFVLAASGYLLLLIHHGWDSAAGWGQRIPGEPGEPDTGLLPLGSASLRIALVALAAALVLPALVPGLDGSGVFSGKGDGSPPSASVVQPTASLAQQLHQSQTIPLMSVRTSQPEYIRLTALEQFDGQAFTLGRLTASAGDKISKGLPSTGSSAPQTSVTSDLAVSTTFAERFLPLTGPPTGIKGVSGDWRLSRQTGTVFSTRDTVSGKVYTVRTQVPDPTAAGLRAQPATVPSNLQVDVGVPAGTDPRVIALAQQVTARATTTYDRALAIQNFLRGPLFTYDLNGAPRDGTGALAEFLLSVRRGYCEQFASAMTVMLRALGIPSRVAIGFTAGTLQADGSYLITNKDAHAWPEIWFPASGWVRFEPTPRNDQSTEAPSYAAAPATGGSTTPPPAAAATPDTQGQDPSPRQRATPKPAPASVGTTGTSGHTSLIGRWWWLGLVAVGLLVLAVPALIRFTRRRRRLSGLAPGSPRGGSPEDIRARTHSAWTELADLAADLGLPLRPADSPRASAVRLADHLAANGTGPVDDARAALMRIAALEERTRYAPPGTTAAGDGASLAADLKVVSHYLREHATFAKRAQARVVPSSVMAGVGRARTTSRRVPPSDDASVPPRAR